MVVQVAGDRLFFEAISHSQKVLDCGVILRTAQAKTDDTTRTWMSDCEAARTTPRPTQPQ